MKKFWHWASQTSTIRSFHGWMTVAWFVASFPLAYMYGASVIFVTFLSLYAIVTGHWSSWQGARAEEAQEEDSSS
jgi:hypothetical protein